MARRNYAVNDTELGAPVVDEVTRQKQLTALAYDLVEKRLRAGTASPSETTYFLKLGTEHTKLERDKLARETELLSAKTNLIKAQERNEASYEEVMESLKSYGGDKLNEGA